MIVPKENINFSKHILISGNSEIERRKLLSKILIKCNLETIVFPKSMKNFGEYINTIEKKKLFEPYYESNRKYNSNQILDFHIDWIAENNCLFVLEEFQNMDDNWNNEILRILINNLETNNKSATKFILTIDDETKLINNLKEIVDVTNYKTKDQVVESNLQIINA